VNLKNGKNEMHYPNIRGFSQAPCQFFLITSKVIGKAMPYEYGSKCKVGS